MLNRIPNHFTMNIQHFQEQVQTTLTAQQKRVAAVALAIFIAVALCYAAYRTYLCLKGSTSEIDENDHGFYIPKPKISYDILNEAKDHFKNNKACSKYVDILVKTGFVYDPQPCLERWKAQSSITNGSPGDEVLQHLEKKLKFDQKTDNPLDKPKIKDETDALRKKIEDHFKPQGSIEGLSWAERAFRQDASGEYSLALRILETGILIDPQGYLEQWEKKRGGTDELRVPEDTVRHFFEKNLPH